MICNTAHIYYDYFSSHTKAPLFDLRNAVIDKLKVGKKYLVFGTSKTINSKMFEKNGVEYLYPSQDELKILDVAIFEFNKGNSSLVQKIVEIARCSDCDAIIAGCTEIELMLENQDIEMVSPISIAVEKVVDFLKGDIHK